MKSASSHDTYSEKDYQQAADFLVSLLGTECNYRSWNYNYPIPDDADALIQVLTKTLQKAHHVLDSGEVYDCFDIPKGPGKTRRIEAPDGPDACIESNIFSEDIQPEIDHIRSVREGSVRAVYELVDYSVYDEKLSGVDDYAKLRHILVPQSGGEVVNVVRRAQRAINHILSGCLPLHNSVCGFRRGSGAYDGLRRILEPFYHRGAEKIGAVYQLDIRNFFPSITDNMVAEGLRKMFQIIPQQYKDLSHKELERTIDIFTHIASFEGRLPQGAHTSPTLANFVAQNTIDIEINELLKLYQTSRTGRANNVTVSYGRYADDIVVISSHPISEALRDGIDLIVKGYFQIADEKRFYEENKKYYTVWGASLLAERIYMRTREPSLLLRRTAEKQSMTDFRFKLPKYRENRIAVIVLQASERIGQLNPWSRDDMVEADSLLRHALGHLSYVYDVSRSGGVWGKGPSGDCYFLPQRLCHAWEKLRKAANDYSGQEERYKKTFQG
ncbi:MAG: reverse transcriptase domain-containing protein [Candidatus Gracilibacteria bacterium]|nr:reverse transcriptase domain-containing protein [Candidatus Gracilibacteria bacterium]